MNASLTRQVLVKKNEFLGQKKLVENWGFKQPERGNDSQSFGNHFFPKRQIYLVFLLLHRCCGADHCNNSYSQKSNQIGNRSGMNMSIYGSEQRNARYTPISAEKLVLTSEMPYNGLQEDAAYELTQEGALGAISRGPPKRKNQRARIRWSVL